MKQKCGWLWVNSPPVYLRLSEKKANSKRERRIKRGMRHYHLHPSGLRCSNLLLNITVTFASRSRKGWSSSLIGIEYSIDRSLCHVTGVVGSGFGGESRPQKKNPKRLVKNINYLKKGHKTLDQVMNILIGPAPFFPIQYNPFHTTQQYISFHSFPLLSIPYA